MAWNARNDFGSRLASIIRKAGERVKQQIPIKLSVQPIMDYMHVMTRHSEHVIGATAGNVATTISGNHREIFEFLSGHIYLDTDANAANRYIRIKKTSSAGNLIICPRSSVITANQTGMLAFGKELNTDSDYDDQVGDVHTWITVPPLYNEQSYVIDILNGVAGDSYSGDYDALVTPIAREL
jgi:hypothetical protein